MRPLALAIVVATATVAFADPSDEAFRAAAELAAKNDPRALEAFESLGRTRPISRWTDDAWVEAARIAERASDFDRARRDLGEAIAISEDVQLVRRAKRDLERLQQLAGASGEWSKVAAEHQRLVTAIAKGGDPTDELEEMEKLARAHPGYPRAVALHVAIARGWEEEDEVDRALRWLRYAIRLAPPAAGQPATPPASSDGPPSTRPSTSDGPPSTRPSTSDGPPSTRPSTSDGPPSTSDVALGPNAERERDRARIELVRMLIRVRELDEAHAQLPLVKDAVTRASLERRLATAHEQQLVRWALGAFLLVLGALATFLLRRRTGSWGAAARALLRPPIEVIYFVPIAAVVAFVSTTGNPLVAKAVIWISIFASIVAWVSGVTLEAAKPVSKRHAIVHVAVVGIAVLASVYLAIDHARLLDLVGETWRTGPGH